MADAADARAGIRTRPARPDELAAVLARFEATWGEGRGPDRSMLQALEHAGNTVLVAAPQVRRIADALGATLGFLGWRGGLHLHSHMNAVDPAARGRGIGVALKLRQRAVCLAHGVDEMRWTYDPLIRRNARHQPRAARRRGRRVPARLLRRARTTRSPEPTAATASRCGRRLGSPRTARALASARFPRRRSEGGLDLVADFEACAPRTPGSPRRLRDASREASRVPAAGRGCAPSSTPPATTSSHRRPRPGGLMEATRAAPADTAATATTIERDRAAPRRGAARAALRDRASGARPCARCSSCGCAPTRATGWGECVAGRDRSTRASTSTARHVIERISPALLPPPGPLAARRPLAGRVPLRRLRSRPSRATPWRRPRSRRPCSTPSCARRALARRAFGAARDWVDCGVAVGIADSSRSCSTRSRLSRAGYRASSSRSGPAGTSCRSPRSARSSARGLLQVDANTAYRPTTSRCSRGSTRSTCCSSSSRSPKRTSPATRLAAADRDADLPRRVDPRAGRGATRSTRGASRSSTSRPGRVGGYLEACACTTSAASSTCRCGAAACSRPGSAAPRTSHSPRCPASRCPATPRRPRYFAEDVTEPFVLGDGEHRGQLRVPDAAGTGVTVREELVRDWAGAPPVVITR